MEAVGGAFVGDAVSRLLDELLTALGSLRNESTTLEELHKLLERSQPSVEELRRFLQDHKHPAGQWFMQLHQQLKRAQDLVKASGDANQIFKMPNIFRRMDTSKEAVQLYDSIHKLLQEASAFQWASGMSIQRIQIENDAKILTALKATQDKQEQLMRKVSNLRSDMQIRSTISELVAEVFSSNVFDGPSSSTVTAPTETVHPEEICDVPKPQVTFGGNAVADEMINPLLSGEYQKWVGLWGMGGIGKTFTASKIYRDTRIQKHFSGRTYWITVSKDHPAPTHLLKQLHEKISVRQYISRLPDELGAAKSCLKRSLERHKVLLVLDDVWQSSALDYLDVVSELKNGVILVTTRDQGILRSVIDLVKIFKIPPLSPEHSWELFSWWAFEVRKRAVPADVEPVARKVAEECQGLPLALEIIASTMAHRQLLPCERALGRTISREWEVALEQLRKANYGSGNFEYETLYRKLQLSVDNLAEHHPRLQDCFFYFAAFPEDFAVNIKELVRIWVAEGLVQRDESNGYSCEEQAKILLGFLVAKSMIHLEVEGTCKIHDVMRDLAQRNLKKDFSSRTCLYAPGLKTSKLPEDWTATTGICYAERLSFRDNDLLQFPDPEQFRARRLQVLILKNNPGLQSLSLGFLQDLSILKVMDLSYTAIGNIPGNWWRTLKSLVLLDLSGCEKLKRLSDGIGELHSLKFLDLNGCRNLVQISDKMGGLQSLEVLNLSQCRELKKIPGPNGIGGLQNLEFLDSFGCYKLQKLPEVKSLTKLKRYSTFVPPRKRNSYLRDAFGLRSSYCIPYELPPDLRQLRLFAPMQVAGENTAELYLFDLASLASLESLYMSDIKPFPAGIAELKQLRVLFIDRCYATPVPSLEKVPLLEELSMHFFHYVGTESYGNAGAFPSLKSFRLYCAESMEEMFVLHPGAMPKIETLHIDFSKTAHLATSITALRSLKHLQLGCGTAISHEVWRKYLELVFREPDCFPDLEELTVSELFSRPRGSHPLEELPIHIRSRHEQGNLLIKF